MSEEHKPGDTQTPPAAGEQPKGKPFEIDYERLKDGDEEYAKEVNAHLAETQPPDGSEQSSVEGARVEGEAPTQGTQQGEEKFVEFPDGDPIYKGEPFKVKQSELKSYVQKGKHLDVEMEAIAPIRKAARTVPQLAEVLEQAARDPDYARNVARIVDSLKAGAKVVLPEEEDDLSDLEVDGLDPDDVQNMARVNRALKQREQEREERRIAKEQEQESEVYAQRDLAARAYVTALRTTEGEVFDKVRPYMKELMAEAERTTDPETFKAFKATVLNPFATDEQGDPVFKHFYLEAKDRYLKKEGGRARRGVTISDPPDNQTRIAPGSTTPTQGESSSGQPDWRNMSQQEFDRRMNEALSRA